MDVHKDIAKWLKDLGFEGNIPADLPSLCNRYTHMIWLELMQNVRPKQDVERVKRNIILNRLKAKPINEQHNFSYKIEEIETYSHKLNIEQKLNLLKQTVEANGRNVNQILKKYKMKEAALKFLKNKIHENAQRQYLLEAKKEQLQQQHLEAEEVLQRLKNVTPVEREESSCTKEITETLEQCALKLKGLLMKDQKLNQEELGSLSITSTTSMKNAEHSFITPITGHDRLFSGTRHDLSGISPFFSETNSIFESSRVTNFNTPRSYNFRSCSRIDLISPFPVLQPTFTVSQESVFKVPNTNLLKRNTKSNGHSIKRLYNHPEVNKCLEKVLRRDNAEVIYETLKKCIQNIDMEFKRITMEEMRVHYKVGNKQILDCDVAKFAFIHVQTEMKILQQNKVLEELRSKINSQKANIMTSLRALRKHVQLEDRLEMDLKQISLETSLTATIKEINSPQFNIEKNESSTLVASRIAKVRKEINDKLQLIKLTIDEMSDTEKYLATSRESISNSNWFMRSLIVNSDWMNALLKSTWLEEMRVFDSFPLEYQRRFTESNIFYRDLSPDLYNDVMQIGSHDMHLLLEILDSPFDPPETILVKLLKTKMKLDVLKIMQQSRRENSLFEVPQKEYSFAELTHQESYLDNAIDRLKTLMMSSKSCKILAAGELVKRSLEIWMDSPMADFISDTRMVEGHNYQYFKNKLNMYL